MLTSTLQVKKKRGFINNWLGQADNYHLTPPHQGQIPNSQFGQQSPDLRNNNEELNSWGQPNIWNQPNQSSPALNQQWGSPYQQTPQMNPFLHLQNQQGPIPQQQFNQNKVQNNDQLNPQFIPNTNFIKGLYDLASLNQHQGQINNQPQIWGNHIQGNQWALAQAKEQNFSFLNLNQLNLAHYIEQQIIQLEQSPSKKKLQQLRKMGQKFIDNRFPPNNNSLCGQWQSIVDWKDIRWMKISAALPKAKIFAGRPLPNDIKQGCLGDCYFLAGLAAICERPDRIYNLFLLQEQNELNYYSVKMLYKGKWMTIDLDQFIPFLNNQPSFSKSMRNDLWVILLEKAWAKLYTSYRRIESGYPQETLHDLTGAPIRQIQINKTAIPKREEEWNYLLKATQRQYAMVCSSNPGSDTQTTNTGVVLGHAYTLLAAVILQFNGQLHRLIKLRNPWGKVQFNGQWSDSDPNWKFIDPNIKLRLGFKEDKNDGIFFIPYQQFWQQFRQITVAQINDNASYLYKSAKDYNGEGCFFKIQIKRQGVYSLQVDKTPERSFQDNRQKGYRYPQATVNLAFCGNGGLQKIEGFSSYSRTSFLKYKMNPGFYLAKVAIAFNPQFQTQFDVNLAIYAQFPCNITLASNQQACSLAGKHVAWNGQEQHHFQPNWNRQSAWGYQEVGCPEYHLQQDGSWSLSLNEKAKANNQQNVTTWGDPNSWNNPKEWGNPLQWGNEPPNNMNWGNQQWKIRDNNKQWKY